MTFGSLQCNSEHPMIPMIPPNKLWLIKTVYGQILKKKKEITHPKGFIEGSGNQYELELEHERDL